MMILKKYTNTYYIQYYKYIILIYMINILFHLKIQDQ